MSIMDRPARIQRKSGPVGPQRGGAPPEINIWTGKKKMSREELASKVRETRCDPERDSGRTRAVPGDAICVFFAQGRCTNGPNCDFWHRIPDDDDEKALGPASDIFGRERYASEREDMGGIGTFSRENRTLYVGRVPSGRAGVQDAVRRAFGAFGALEHVKVLADRNCAFAKYRLRAAAEFAKEALAEQPLFAGGEPMNLRWSHEDPNPGVRKREAAQTQEELAAHLESQGVCLRPADFQYPAHYQLPSEKRQRLAEEEGQANSDYPDTDAQYSGVAAARAAIAAASRPAREPKGVVHNGVPGGLDEAAPEQEPPGGEWVQFLSPEGYPYFHCPARNSTVWQLPRGARVVRVEAGSGGPLAAGANGAAAQQDAAARAASGAAQGPEKPQGLDALAAYGEDSDEEA